MILYDSKDQVKKRLTDKRITIYNCGPTVYNHVHIGNVRPLITLDILFRYLKAMNIDVKYALNLTDVDDKIINRAEAEGTTETNISKKYTKAYFDLFKKLNIIKQDYNPKVTTNIKGIISYINKLVKKHKAYIGKNGDVYFDINSVKKTYGELSKQKLNELLHNVRKDIDEEQKKNPLDFVLWKHTTHGVNWKSPWNSHGRPGWHTECSYFINKLFGDNGVTIHAGGIDLKFPHHENEEAQNRALLNKPLAKNWMHVGHININNEKMSKSANNFILAKDILEKFNGNDIRWFFLQTQYENPINFTNQLLEQSHNDFSKIIKTINSTIINLKLNKINFVYKKVKLSKDFIKFMDDDMNLPNVVAHIYSLVKNNSSLIKEKKFNNVALNLNTVITELRVLGFVVKTISATNPKIVQWANAYCKRQYSEVDAIRKALTEKEVI